MLVPRQLLLLDGSSRGPSPTLAPCTLAPCMRAGIVQKRGTNQPSGTGTVTRPSQENGNQHKQADFHWEAFGLLGWDITPPTGCHLVKVWPSLQEFWRPMPEIAPDALLQWFEGTQPLWVRPPECVVGLLLHSAPGSATVGGRALSTAPSCTTMPS